MTTRRTDCTWVTHSAAETVALGRALGRQLAGGETVALAGPLGSGKTQFTKGLARGLDVTEDEPVVSPTFVLIREYVGRVPLFHLDTYRLGHADELAALGWDELLASGGVVVVEWADRFPELLPPDAWRVELGHVGPESRRITLTREPPVDAAVLAALKAVNPTSAANLPPPSVR
jgi:tRNA threonylcarbamoyladenosine biosynthesis protein TsaE